MLVPNFYVVRMQARTTTAPTAMDKVWMCSPSSCASNVEPLFMPIQAASTAATARDEVDIFTSLHYGSCGFLVIHDVLGSMEQASASVAPTADEALASTMQRFPRPCSILNSLSARGKTALGSGATATNPL